MALTATTLASAVAQLDTSIVVASATGAAAGTLILIDQETMQVAQNYTSGTTIPVLRGRDGAAQVAHPTSSKVLFFLASDETGPLNQFNTQFPTSRGRQVLSYSASGALTLPTPGYDAVAFLNGASLLAMTLANPTADLDGCVMTITGIGTVRAHTVTYTAGFGNVGATADVVTMSATQVQAFQIIASGGFWNLIALGTATASVTGPTVA